MIQILIVEDEIPARNSLKKDVASILDGGAVISVAGDGIEALEIASNFRPDILLTDIRMPRMLGTQLAEKVLELYPLCKVIFLSGYSDKNFLRFAIKLGVIDYIEKPIDFEDLKKALTKAVATVQELTSNSHAGDDAILSDLFKSRPAAALPLPQNGSFAAAILSPCTEYTSPIITLIKDTAQKSALNAYCHKKNTGAVEILLVNSGGDIRSKINALFTRFFFCIGENERFKCAVGSIEYAPEHIYKSYQNAVYTTDLAFFRPTNTITYTDDVSSDVQEPKEDFEKTANAVYTALIDGNLNTALRGAEVLYNSMSNTCQLLSASAKKIYYSLFEAIMEYYEKFFPVSKSDNLMLYSKFSAFDSQCLLELHEYLLMLLHSISDLAPAAKGSVTDLAIFYLEQHYTNPNLSISDIVRFCKINTSQLCNIFKKTTGYTINHYLTQMRVDAAKKLLTESNHKINDISDMCGFNYPKYFCRVFKKYTSLSPSDYRRKKQKRT